MDLTTTREERGKEMLDGGLLPRVRQDQAGLNLELGKNKWVSLIKQSNRNTK